MYIYGLNFYIIKSLLVFLFEREWRDNQRAREQFHLLKKGRSGKNVFLTAI